MSGLVDAVEKEERECRITPLWTGEWHSLYPLTNNWPILLGQSVDQCYIIDEALSRFAREYPEMKFLASSGSACLSRPYIRKTCQKAYFRWRQWRWGRSLRRWSWDLPRSIIKRRLHIRHHRQRGLPRIRRKLRWHRRFTDDAGIPR